MNDEPKTMNDERRTPNGSDMPDDIALSVRNVSKKFCRNLKRSMHYGTKDLACNLVGVRQDTSKIRRDEFWALKDVSFDLKRGESLGIIGVNGCGKSTLFRVIHGIYPPDTGDIRMRGRAGALIALGAGFHPHMTGRENIFLNGTILGIPVAEIRERLDEIIEFSELDEFIDAPVSTYSSGMYVRLGFSVAVHMDPDILLIDEVLAVGDVSFQNKCLKYLRKLLAEDRTILFVSHSTSNIRKICSRVVLLEHGEVVKDGPTEEVVALYLQRTARAAKARSDGSSPANKAAVVTHQSDLAQIQSVQLVGASDETVGEIGYTQNADLCMRFEVFKPLPNVHLELLFYSPDGGCRAARTQPFYFSEAVSPGVFEAQITLNPIELTPGLYTIHACLYDEDSVLSMIEDITSVVVVPKVGGVPHNLGGFFVIRGECEIKAVGKSLEAV